MVGVSCILELQSTSKVRDLVEGANSLGYKLRAVRSVG